MCVYYIYIYVCKHVSKYLCIYLYMLNVHHVTTQYLYVYLDMYEHVYACILQ